MTKVVLKSIGTTLLAIVLLLTMAFAVLSLVFPSTMVEACSSLGLNGFAARYAAIEYSRTEQAKDIAQATEYAIFAEDDALIAEYGASFLADEEFDSFCQTEGAGYAQYIRGQIAGALYRTGKKDEAIAAAFDGNTKSFPQGNAIISLSVVAIDAKDKVTCAAILGKLNEYHVSEDQEKDLETIKSLLKEIANE